MGNRRFSDKRLWKLVFWLIHLVAILAIIFGVFLLVRINAVEKSFLAEADKCKELFQGSSVSWCVSDWLTAIDKYDLKTSVSLFGGLGLVFVYWMIRWLHSYLFPKSKQGK